MDSSKPPSGQRLLAVKRDREPSSEANFVTRLRGAKFAVIPCTMPRQVTPTVIRVRAPSSEAKSVTRPRGADFAI